MGGATNIKSGLSIALKIKEEKEVPPSVNEVFKKDEVRTIILDYAIRSNDKDGRVCRPMIPVCRLVQKAWLLTTTKILQKSYEPLLKLELTKENSVSGSRYVQENGKLLEQFISTVTSDSRLDNCIPPFRLKITEDFFRQENHQSFSDLLVKCGGGLVELELSVPWRGGSLTCLFPRVNLPLLKRLTVTLKGAKLKLSKEEVVSSDDVNLVQFLLHATETLTHFTLPYDSKLPALPFRFSLLSLPTTLTKLVLNCKLLSADLKVLVRNSLPKLTYLKFSVLALSEGDGEGIFRILENFRETLRNLSIFGSIYSGPPRRKIPFYFPVMEKLEMFSTSSLTLELEREADSPSLEKCLPKLTSLELFGQTAGMLRKWTDKSKLTSVTYLQLLVSNEEVAESWNSEHVLGLDMETMKRLHSTFPNLRKLELHLSLSASETSGLTYMFRNLKKLTNLKLVVCENNPEVTSDIWDSVLTGVSVEFIACLRTNPKDGKIVTIDNDIDKVPSIRMMEGLKMLSLEAINNDPSTPPHPLISDLAFHHAFLKMPHLKDLRFQGRFMASEKITRLWISKQKSLMYKP